MKALEAASDELGRLLLPADGQRRLCSCRLYPPHHRRAEQKLHGLLWTGKQWGDGFVAARKLLEYKANVIVVLADGLPRTETSYQMYDQARRMELTFFDYETDEESVQKYLSTADIVVDAPLRHRLSWGSCRKSSALSAGRSMTRWQR